MARAKKEAHKGWCGVVWCGGVWWGGVGCVPDVLTTLWCLLWSICTYNSAYHIMCQLIYCLTSPPLLPEQPTGIWLSSLPWGGGGGGTLDLAWKGLGYLNWHLNSMLVFGNRNWNKPIFKSSNAWKVTWRGDVEALYWLMHVM